MQAWFVRSIGKINLLKGGTRQGTNQVIQKLIMLQKENGLGIRGERKLMQFIKDKDLYKVARITGPTHNFLAIRLPDTKCVTQLTPLPIKPGDVERLDGTKILAQVLSGLDEVNQEFGKEYFVSEVQFVPSDTKPLSAYAFLVREIIKRIESNNEFVVL